MKTNYFTDRNAALDYLLDKYEVKGSGKITDSGDLQIGDKVVGLLPWRMERRFLELKKLIDDKMIEDVSTFRFAHLMPAGEKSLDELITQELDLCEWLGGSKAHRIFAVYNGDNATNIIVKLKNGFSCSVECSVMLPEGAMKIDRHEIIARKGVASDQVVDTQVPQSSIYTYTSEDAKRFTDVDAEIFGLSQADVNIVRASFDVLSNPALADELKAQSQHLETLIAEAKATDANFSSCTVKGDK